MFIMDHFGRQNFGQFYGGHLGPYWLPRRHYQSSQQAILVVQVPVRATLKHKKFDQPNVMHSLKSRAQRQRDNNRRQTFLEQKSLCAMPFYGLEG